MVLVPGPHILNGAFDLIDGRINLGAACLLFAGMIVLAITAGLLIGLALPGDSPPVEAPGRVVPLWQDVVAAGVAVACYSIFYSTPTRLIISPVLVGMAAHALHTGGITYLGFDTSTGAFVACAFCDDARRLLLPSGQRPGADSAWRGGFRTPRARDDWRCHDGIHGGHGDDHRLGHTKSAGRLPRLAGPRT